MKAILKISKRFRINIPHYFFSVGPKELICWINNLEEQLDCVKIVYLERLRFAKTKVKGYVVAMVERSATRMEWEKN